MKCDDCQGEFQELRRAEKDWRFLCRDCSNPNLIRPMPMPESLLSLAWYQEKAFDAMTRGKWSFADEYPAY
ncbi:MAG: hypothetical protein K2X27_18295 [Candidatus Obscuribacterales bacterium]|nr:hypothetical protein [Candidatus Obscuribacterales bacterium]